MLCLVLSRGAQAQMVFSGTVGKAPIELVLDDNDPGDGATGIYVYSKHNTPITLSGALTNGTLVLTEKGDDGKPAATFTVPGFDTRTEKYTGTWKSLSTGREYPLALVRRYLVAETTEKNLGKRELLQAATLPQIYFRVVLGKAAEQGALGVTAVKLLDKKTDRLLQEIKVACQLQGVNNVSVGDFNFDGQPDFAVFESSYAGPNTSSLYFLYDPRTNQYVDSGFKGTSLEFDAKKKRITERNSCCGGSSVSTAEYRVADNKMVLVARHCYKWDDKRKQLVERKASACN